MRSIFILILLLFAAESQAFRCGTNAGPEGSGFRRRGRSHLLRPLPVQHSWSLQSELPHSMSALSSVSFFAP